MILGLAPMDGYTDCAFRQIVKEIFDKYGEKSSAKNHQLKTNDLYLWTEFMTADGYIAKPEAVVFHLMTDTSQKNVVAQIHGGNTESLLKTVKDINKKYADVFVGIELNTGCPANNIMKSWGGSELLKDKKKLLESIKLLKKNSMLPFSIKTRTGLNDADKQAQFDFLVEASKYCDMITVHGRTTNKVYSGEADWKFIYELKKQCTPTCKIIGNGGIKSYEDIKIVKWHLDWVMIGQAAIGNPRIFTPHIPSKKEIKEIILKHLDYTIAYQYFFEHGNIERLKDWIIIRMPTQKDIEKIITEWKHPSFHRSIVEFRKHLFQYLKWIPWSKEFKQTLSQIKEYKPLVEAIQEFLVS